MRKAGGTQRWRPGRWMLGVRCNWRMGRWLAVPPSSGCLLRRLRLAAPIAGLTVSSFGPWRASRDPLKNHTLPPSPGIVEREPHSL